MNILDEIVAKRKQDVAKRKQEKSLPELEKSPFFQRSVISASSYITAPEKSGIIAEHKRASPSKGIINNTLSVIDVTTAYEKAGASCISILTEEHYFKGSAQDIREVRDSVSIPILRKDFIVNEYQIVEAKALGADFILLIAAYLSQEQIRHYTQLAHSLDLEVLCEIHTQSEVDKCIPEINIIGVNNRNLKDFSVDIEHSIALLEHIPASFVRISESGISNPETVIRLKSKGFDGFLMGENFMKHNAPGKACAQFIKESNLLS
ncbi:MAG: indole-3-glycerol phosphate synthase TrpC [Bacteroidales bacterium]